MKNIFLMCLFLTLVISTSVSADCLKNEVGKIVCGEGQCVVDQYLKVFCSAEGGGAIKNLNGIVECGVGRCITDSSKKIWCSNEVNGDATIDPKGKVRCIGECVPGSTALCHEAK